MGFAKEFKEFAMKGNVVDLAIGVVVGGAFQKIVTSLIDDVITPLLLTPAMKAVHAENIKDYKIGHVTIGLFISNILSFLVVAFVLFLVIRALNKLKKGEATATPEPSATENLLTEIRDLLKK